ncbi:MAG: phenylacetate-CoA oxygenase subunit PaaJ [Gammaproteobacteria bacterium]|uniref:1,2-phenylacetyl-CoA epoxidase subunit PaaD n=1 Tax=Nevskia sp. TaxID=1929292 RepID=UPI004036C67B|nr:phenylacetate-CoA oxygenase subunit PaaJ [Gammaproteobacteria bacterium]
MSAAAAPPSLDQVWTWLAEVPDPEIPVISITDLGIVRDARYDGAQLVVTVTPTYSGCPATEVIAEQIRAALAAHGIADARMETRLSPAWTTDWLSDEGRRKLHDYGIAPPVGRAAANEHAVDLSRLRRMAAAPVVACPRCGSTRTEVLSPSGSTPCKSLYRCTACREPFDYFKCH